MLKNVIIVGLSFIVVMFWIRVDPECVNTDDPNTVTIEYQCSDLSDYENVPPEVVEECTKRAEEATNHKPKT
jgi:phosphodiesterase/alkaline phosphatase D-like protein